MSGTLVGSTTGEPGAIDFHKDMTLAPGASLQAEFTVADTPVLRIPVRSSGGSMDTARRICTTFPSASSRASASPTRRRRSSAFAKIEYAVPGSDNLTLVVNNVKVMVHGGNWGLDEGMKRISRERLDTQFRMHALVNINLVRN